MITLVIITCCITKHVLSTKNKEFMLKFLQLIYFISYPHLRKNYYYRPLSTRISAGSIKITKLTNVYKGIFNGKLADKADLQGMKIVVCKTATWSEQ